MFKPLIIANWKCNPLTLIKAEKLFGSIKQKIKNVENVEVVFCPPFVYLASISKQKLLKIKLGAQDCFWENPPEGKGSYTGEISPIMLKNLGCEYLIVGHSERRQILKETDEMINKKLNAVLKQGLTPVFCIGETYKEKKQVYAVLKTQIKQGLKDIPKAKIKNIIIAYEPIWAIGAKKPCDFNTAMTMRLLIKKILSSFYGRSIAEQAKILYGGSVTQKDAKGFIVESGMAGLLVGRASMDPVQFAGIIKQVS